MIKIRNPKNKDWSWYIKNKHDQPIFFRIREREKKKINRRQTISLLPTSATSGGKGSGDSSNNKVE